MNLLCQNQELSCFENICEKLTNKNEKLIKTGFNENKINSEKILNLNYPSAKTIKKACQLSKSLNKPIKLNYYIDSLKGSVCITLQKNEKIIFKNYKEYSKPIKNTFKINHNYIVVTEDTIYIISTKIKYF